MNIKELRTLTLMIQYGTVSYVANMLNMTQPGVSRILKSLEKKVKRQLFYRYNNKLMPTKYALQLAESATPILEDFDTLSDRFIHKQLSDMECMNIIAPNIFSVILTQTLYKMHQDKIYTNINLATSSSAQAITKMAHQNYHLGGISHNTPISGDLHITPLARSPIQCVAHQDSSLANLSVITPEILAQHKVIHAFHRQSEETRNINRIFRNIRTKDFPFYATDTHMACELISYNMGVGLMSDIIAKILVAKIPHIVIIPFCETLYQNLNWITPSHSAPHPKVSQIIEYTQDIIGEYSPNSTVPQ